MRVLLAGEPAAGFTVLPGVASLPLVGSRARAPLRQPLCALRRCHCWSTAIVACVDAEVFVGLGAPTWARLLVALRRRRRGLSQPVWARDQSSARDTARAAAVVDLG